jgi:hypothetical protein
MSLTPDAVLALAPDDASVRAASAIAAPQRWVTLATDDALLWGEVRGGDLYRVAAALEGPHFLCSCPSPKRPCKHALALLLAYARAPGSFARGPGPPPWVTAWGAKQTPSARREPRGPVADPTAQAQRAEHREARIAQGLEDVDRWMRDLVRHGLAAAQARGPEIVDEPAARLVDAQAPGLARRVRGLGGTLASGSGWPERMTERLGLLHLLVEAYRRQGELSPALRADVRALVGWTQSQDDLLAAAGVQDRWLVRGERVEEDERYVSQRLWLQGSQSGRWALLLTFAASGTPLNRQLRPGFAVDAELVFYPGATPTRALLKGRGAGGPMTAAPGLATIVEAYAQYGAALAQNPWVDDQPLALAAVIPQESGAGWVVRDAAADAIPLARHFAHEQRLSAVAGGRPVALFGEWNGRTLLPLAAFAEGRHVQLAD